MDFEDYLRKYPASSKILAKLEREKSEFNRRSELVKRYQAAFPDLQITWDTNVSCVKYCSIDIACSPRGVTIYICPLDEVFRGLRKECAEVHLGSTIWTQHHTDHKIALAIEAWEKGIPLSPIFVLKPAPNKGSVIGDGHHRITVAHQALAEEIAFIVMGKKPSWVLEDFPSARFIRMVSREEFTSFGEPAA